MLTLKKFVTMFFVRDGRFVHPIAAMVLVEEVNDVRKTYVFGEGEKVSILWIN